jgi:hypothetical protein
MSGHHFDRKPEVLGLHRNFEIGLGLLCFVGLSVGLFFDAGFEF